MARALGRFLAIRTADELASQMLTVAIGWYVYSATHNPMSLAYAGLAQFLPNAAMALVAGHAADRFERRKVVAWAMFAQGVGLAGFTLWTVSAAPSAAPVYVLLLLMGAARAFGSPSMSALLPNVVSAEEFPRAVAAASSTMQICTIAGPAVGGMLYAVGGRVVFAVAAALYLAGMTQAWRLPAGTPRHRIGRRKHAGRGFATYGRIVCCSGCSRSICLRCCWAGSARCCRFTPAIFCPSDRLGSDGCDAHRARGRRWSG